jgi:hypothetical protein
MEIPKEWQERMQPNEEQQYIAEKRFKICNECPSLTKSDNEFWILECGECGCYIGQKIYSGAMGGCPLNKWGLSIEDTELFQKFS